MCDVMKIRPFVKGIFPFIDPFKMYFYDVTHTTFQRFNSHIFSVYPWWKLDLLAKHIANSLEVPSFLTGHKMIA